MPRTQIPVSVPSRAGTVLPPATAVDVTNGNYINNSGQTIFTVFNGGASPYNVTVTVRKTVDGQAVASRVTAVAASANVLFGPYPVEDYGTQIYIDGSNVALTVRAYER